MMTDYPYLAKDSVLPRLNAVRFFVVLAIALGYASTMPLGPNEHEISEIFGYEPSWIGIQTLFFFSGLLAYKSVINGRRGLTYLKSRVWRVLPLLFVMTLTTVLVIYPLLGKPLSTPQDFLALGKYFFLTVTCLDPGRVLPGLLDDAIYMCLIQGAIWTLRWGLILHIFVVIAAHFKSLLKPRVVLISAMLSTLAYGITAYVVAKQGLEFLRVPLIGMRLGYIFLVGMAVWAYRDRLPRARWTGAAIALSLFIFAGLNYAFLPWTTFIEISLTLSLVYGAWLIASSTGQTLRWLANWPHLALGLYLTIWPTTQVVLHAYPELTSATLPMVALPIALALTGLSYVALTGRLNHYLDLRLGREVPVQPTRL